MFLQNYILIFFGDIIIIYIQNYPNYLYTLIFIFLQTKLNTLILIFRNI